MDPPLSPRHKIWGISSSLKNKSGNGGTWVQMDDASITEVLERRLKVKAGELLFVQTTVPVKRLPKLCSKFHCFTRDSVWQERSDEVRPAPHISPQVHMSILTSICKIC